jgi:alkylated DNA nucleotide flippase Atl1
VNVEKTGQVSLTAYDITAQEDRLKKELFSLKAEFRWNLVHLRLAE